MAVLFSPDGSKIASGQESNELKLWELATGRLMWTGVHEDMIWQITFSPEIQRSPALPPRSQHTYLGYGTETPLDGRSWGYRPFRGIHQSG